MLLVSMIGSIRWQTMKAGDEVIKINGVPVKDNSNAKKVSTMDPPLTGPYRTTIYYSTC